MNTDWLQRTEMLIGPYGLHRLRKAKVIIFGLGGVGGAAAEALARAGIGTLGLVDKDILEETNLNRQIIALRSTLGKPKVEVMAARIRDIDPSIEVTTYHQFYLPETASEIPLDSYDYVVDAIDNVTGKIELICRCNQQGIPLISSMGMGNRLDPLEIRVADIFETQVCPLAKVMRKELRQRGIPQLRVVYSLENPVKQTPPGSIAFVPPVAGMVMACQVVKNMLEDMDES